MLLFIGVMFNISAHFLLKKGMQGINEGFDNGFLSILKVVISDSYLWISATLYAIGFIIYAIVLTKVDISKAIKELDHKLTIDLESGVKKTIEWMKGYYNIK